MTRQKIYKRPLAPATEPIIGSTKIEHTRMMLRDLITANNAVSDDSTRWLILPQTPVGGYIGNAKEVLNADVPLPAAHDLSVLITRVSAPGVDVAPLVAKTNIILNKIANDSSYLPLFEGHIGSMDTIYNTKMSFLQEVVSSSFVCDKCKMPIKDATWLDINLHNLLCDDIVRDAARVEELHARLWDSMQYANAYYMYMLGFKIDVALTKDNMYLFVMSKEMVDAIDIHKTNNYKTDLIEYLRALDPESAARCSARRAACRSAAAAPHGHSSVSQF